MSQVRTAIQPLVWICGISCFTFASLPAANRLPARIDEQHLTRLTGSWNSRANAANDRGRLDASQPISHVSLVLQPSPEQQADLEQLLEGQRDPASPNYRQWLTPEQFGERFGPSQSDLNTLTLWLQTNGFSVDQIARGRGSIEFSGATGRMESAFHTEMHSYEVKGRKHYANATEISIPAALSGVVSAIRGLDSFPLERVGSMKRVPLGPDFTTGSGAAYLGPDDFATIYNTKPLLAGGIDGTGQKLVIAGQTSVNLSDIETFRAYFSLPANDPKLVLYGNDPGKVNGDYTEAMLDLEWSGAIAPKASIIYVYSTNVIASVQYAIDNNLAPVISMSYGGCEQTGLSSLRTLAQQANAQGITWMNSSGDSGAAACGAQYGLLVSFPADVPEITAVGGTEFNEGSSTYWNRTNNAANGSAISYIPEKAWAYSGGGVSKQFPKPSWQTGPGVPADGGRDVPDVSLSASGHDGYLIFDSGYWEVVAGTSASSPAFAAIVTLLNQALVSKGTLAKAGLGNINPALYNLAASTTGVFHDITAGNNYVPCTGTTAPCINGQMGYAAGPGFDLATGLGTVDANNLVAQWTHPSPAAATSVAVNPAQVTILKTGSAQIGVTVTASSSKTVPTGSVNLQKGATVLGTAALTASGSGAAASLSLPGSSLEVGTNTITAVYPGVAGLNGSSTTVSVTVTPVTAQTTLTLGANPISIPSTGSTQLSVTVKAAAAAPPAGQISFLLGKTPLGSTQLTASGTANFTLQGAALTTGANTITASYAGSASFSPSTATVVVTVTTPPPATTALTVTANPAAITPSASTTLTATVKAASATAVPAGSVSFVLGKTTLAAIPLSASGTASFTLQGAALTTGANTITASYAGTASFSPSTATGIVTVTTPPPAATSLTLTANPVSISPSASAVLTATVKAALGSATPTGSVSFILGKTTLAAVPLSATGSANFTLQGSALTTGANTVTASYTGNDRFGPSTAAATVSLSPPPQVNTSLTVLAAPASILASGSTIVSAAVLPASGTAIPDGTVTFSLAGASLGSGKVVATTTGPMAAIPLSANRLTVGANTITASYSGSTAFKPSNGTVVVTVVAAPVATTTAAVASPASIAPTASTQITATVKAASGAASPTGSMSFSLGQSLLGSSPLMAGPNGSATASFTVPGSKLVSGQNTILARYPGASGFQDSAAFVAVTVTPPGTNGAMKLSAKPAELTAAGSTQLTATIQPASGTPPTAGTVTFLAGKTVLGSVPFTAAGAVLTVKGTSLSPGVVSVVANYTAPNATTGYSATIPITVH